MKERSRRQQTQRSPEGLALVLSLAARRFPLVFPVCSQTVQRRELGFVPWCGNKYYLHLSGMVCWDHDMSGHVSPCIASKARRIQWRFWFTAPMSPIPLPARSRTPSSWKIGQVSFSFSSDALGHMPCLIWANRHRCKQASLPIHTRRVGCGSAGGRWPTAPPIRWALQPTSGEPFWLISAPATRVRCHE